MIFTRFISEYCFACKQAEYLICNFSTYISSFPLQVLDSKQILLHKVLCNAKLANLSGTKYGTYSFKGQTLLLFKPEHQLQQLVILLGPTEYLLT